MLTELSTMSNGERRQSSSVPSEPGPDDTVPNEAVPVDTANELTKSQRFWAALGFRERVPDYGVPHIARSQTARIGILPMLGAPRPEGITYVVSRISRLHNLLDMMLRSSC